LQLVGRRGCGRRVAEQPGMHEGFLHGHAAVGVASEAPLCVCMCVYLCVLLCSACDLDTRAVKGCWLQLQADS
jgi:hypothetical protein